MLLLPCFCLSKGISLASKAREKVGEVLADNYYIQKKAVFHGLPIAVVSSVAMGYLFGSGGVLMSAAYGAVNYSVITFLLEWHGPPTEPGADKVSAILTIGFGYLLATAFVQTVLKSNLTYTMALPLALGAFAGTIARQWVWEREEAINYQSFLYF